jgi:hypothetical protein
VGEEEVNRRTTAILVLTVSLVLVAGLMMFLTRSPFLKTSFADQAGLETMTSVTSASILVDPMNQGALVSPGETAPFQLTIENTGSAPSDTFEISVNSSWPASLFGPDENTPLQDTNNSGTVDSGPLAPGAIFDLYVKVEISQQAKLGDQNTTTLQISSWLSPEVSTETLISTAVPAAMTQVFRDGENAQSLYLIQSKNQEIKQASVNNNGGQNPAIAETLNGYALVWSRWRFINDRWISELEYTLTDKYGNTIKPVSRLTDHSSAARRTHDFRPVITASAGGNIAITWYREQIDDEDEVNQNIFLAIIDELGNVVFGPENLTNNTAWGPVGASNVPQYNMPRIASTGDDHFFTAWNYTLGNPDISAVRDIYFDIRASNGDPVTTTVNLTNDLPDLNGNVSPVLASVTGNRVLVAWVFREPENDDVFFTVLDSDGNTVKETQNLSTDDRVIDWVTFDAQELYTGRIIVAWKAWGCSSTDDDGRIRYATISNAYRRIGQPKCLSKESLAVGGDWGVSMAVDADDNLSFTWTDDWTYLQNSDAKPNLYYALLDKNGAVNVKPMIIYRTLEGKASLSINHEGYGSASRIFVDSFVAAGPISNDPQDPKMVEIMVRYGNQGTGPTSGLVLTSTLDPNLTYQGSTSVDATPVITGNQIIWEGLNDLGAFESDNFLLFVSLPPDSPPEASYPLTLTLSTENFEISDDNNEVVIKVGEQNTTVYLPLVLRNE